MCDNYEALSKTFRRLRLLYAIYLIGSITALALFFVNRWATLVALGICLVYYVFAVRPASRLYSRSFVHVCAQSSLARHLSQPHHSHESVLDMAEIREASLIPANSGKGGIVLHEGGVGEYHGHKVRMGDATFTHSYTTLLGKTRHQFTNGLYLVAELGGDSGLDMRILFSNATEAGSLDKMLRDEPSLERLDGAAKGNSDWTYICTKGNNALPEEKLIHALGKLDKAIDGWAAVCVQGDKLHVYLIDRLLGQRVNSRYAPDANVERADLIPELDEALNLIDCF